MTKARHRWNRIKLRLPELTDKRVTYLLVILILLSLAYGFAIRHDDEMSGSNSPAQNYLSTLIPILVGGFLTYLRTSKNGKKIDDVKDKAAETAAIANRVAHQTNGGLTARLQQHDDIVVERVTAMTQQQLADMRAQILADTRELLEEDAVSVNRLIQRERGPAMTTRADIVRIALSHNGENNGAGYGTAGWATRLLRRPAEYPCDDFVTAVYVTAKLPLPKERGDMTTGSCSCAISWNYAVSHKATKSSWEALPGDQVIFTWSNGTPDHTELVERWDPVTHLLWTVGDDSGPSNVDKFTGDGGTHRQTWICPPGTGNTLILGVIDTGKLVAFSDET